MNKNALSIIALMGGLGFLKKISGSSGKTSKLTVLNHHFKGQTNNVTLLFLPKKRHWIDYVRIERKEYDDTEAKEKMLSDLNEIMGADEWEEKAQNILRSYFGIEENLKRHDRAIAFLFNKTFIEALDFVIDNFEVVYENFLITIEKETVEKKLSEPPDTWVQLANVPPRGLGFTNDMHPLVDFTFEVIDLRPNVSVGKSMIELDAVLKNHKENIEKLFTNMINKKIYQIGKEKGQEFPDDFFEKVFYDNRYSKGSSEATDPNDQRFEIFSMIGYGEFNLGVKKEVYVIPETGYPIKYSKPLKKDFLRRR